jgi:hypothetical protein
VATVIHIVIARLRSGGKGKEGLWGVVASQASHVERWTAWVPTTRDAGEGGKAGAPPPGGGGMAINGPLVRLRAPMRFARSSATSAVRRLRGGRSHL